MRRIAIIDLGTNTFNLLIVDAVNGGFEPVFTTKIGVGIGLGGINENRLAADAIERAIETLQEFTGYCEDYKVEKIHAFGTSAIRNAANQAAFLLKVKEEIGLTIQVITGDQEANYIYQGVLYGHSFEKPGVIMDIGGGSTEFILAHKERMIEAKSFEIGVARIFQKFQFSDPMTFEDCLRIENYLSEKIGDFFDHMEVAELVGASGSFETFYELSKKKAYPINEFTQLSRVEMEESLLPIIQSTQAERDKNPLIIPIRKKMAPIAAVKIRWIIRKLNVQSVIISPYALKEGVIKTVLK